MFHTSIPESNVVEDLKYCKLSIANITNNASLNILISFKGLCNLEENRLILP